MYDRIAVLQKWYLIRKSLDVSNGIEPSRKTHLMLQRIERAQLVDEVKKVKAEFKMNDLVRCITRCLNHDCLIYGKTPGVNQSCFVNTICDLKVSFDEEASWAVLKQMINAVNKAASENKFVDLEDFKNKVDIRNIDVLVKNIKLIKGDVHDDFNFFKAVPRNNKTKKRPMEDNALAVRLNVPFKSDNNKKIKSDNRENSWNYEKIINHQWRDRNAEDFDGSKPKNWIVGNLNHEWCEVPCGGPHPKTKHVFHNGKVDADMMLKHNLSSFFAIVDRKKIRMKKRLITPRLKILVIKIFLRSRAVHQVL